MNIKVLQKEVQDFILENLKTDISKLILKGSPFKEITIQEIAQQIIGKQKAKDKLPTWFTNNNLYFPPKLNLEQTSSEITADYKSKIVRGKSCIDLTGGFGIDSYYFSKQFNSVIHCEVNKELVEIAQHNSRELNSNNIEFIHKNGIEYLATTDKTYDCIYIDPSRRNNTKGKVFLLEDCLPKIPEHIDSLFVCSNTILIKYSPMLDIQIGINNLKFVKEIHVVAVDNEVKELLFLLEKNYNKTVTIKTINFAKNNVQKFQFTKSTETEINYSEPLTYLYEPNVAILKSGAFKELAEKLKVHKLHQHSHLYTSDELIDFPGRIFKIQENCNYKKGKIKSLIKTQANITCRNFPLSVDEIRKKLKLKSGGKKYLFFTTNLNNQFIVLKTTKVHS